MTKAYPVEVRYRVESDEDGGFVVSAYALEQDGQPHCFAKTVAYQTKDDAFGALFRAVVRGLGVRALVGDCDGDCSQCGEDVDGEVWQ